MPTAYTDDVGAGKVTEFKDFAMRCARAFGPCIELRDEPFDKPIPEKFEPNVYYVNAVEDAEERMRWLAGLSDAEIAAEAEKEAQNIRDRHAEYVAERNAENDRYRAMMDRARAWEPPTEEHIHMKEFMLDQLSKSISEPGEPWQKIPSSPKEWHDAAIAECARDIERQKQNLADEIDRTEKRNRWIADLRASLISTGIQADQK